MTELHLSRVHTESGGRRFRFFNTKSTYRRVPDARRPKRVYTLTLYGGALTLYGGAFTPKAAERRASIQSQRASIQRLERVFTLTLYGDAPPRRFWCERGIRLYISSSSNIFNPYI